MAVEKISPSYIKKEKMRRVVTIALAVVVIVAVVIGGKMLYARYFGPPQPDARKWQAVFLVNGQVYFGKLDRWDSRHAVLTNIYYLQVSQSLQQANETSDAQQNINLIKLGEELHGPEDVMYIDRDKVLFWENLKNDSKVVQAINDRK